MRAIVIVFSLILLEAAAVAQQPLPADAVKAFASSADITAMMAKAKKERKPDQATFAQRILQLPPYNVSLEYRAIVGTASVHEKEAEMFYVVDGAATLVTGGKLVDEKRTNPTNLSGSGIEGGTSRPIAKGDFIIIPENTPHWFDGIKDTPLVVMSLHLPHPLPAH